MGGGGHRAQDARKSGARTQESWLAREGARWGVVKALDDCGGVGGQWCPACGKGQPGVRGCQLSEVQRSKTVSRRAVNRRQRPP